jgi:hypothetical protein
VKVASGGRPSGRRFTATAEGWLFSNGIVAVTFQVVMSTTDT